MNSWREELGLTALDGVVPAFDSWDPTEMRIRHSLIERLGRAGASTLLHLLPAGLYRACTTLLKRIRGRRLRVSPTQFPAHRLLPGHRISAPRVLLTHDVDTRRGYDFWDRVVELEESYGVVSSWNVLTDGPYSLDATWLDGLEARGFEIGLHGDTHDPAIGFRRAGDIRRRIGRCLEMLDRPVAGFRAPAYGASDQLMVILLEFGFLYDSSVKVRCFFDEGARYAAPYPYPGTALWELPLAISDDGLLRDKALPDGDAIRAVATITDLLSACGALVVINSHPVNLIGRMGFYEGVLEEITARDAVVELPKTLVQRLGRRAASMAADGRSAGA